MNRLLAILLLFLTTLSACVARKTEIPTQNVITPPSTLFPPTEIIFPIGDGGLISGQPCAAPCFLGIRVGKTPLDNVVSILGDNGISPCTKDVDHVSCGLSIFIGAHSSTLTVDSVGYVPGIPASVENIIGKYGQPNSIHVVPGGIPEAPTTTVLLFFDSIKMRVHLPEVEEVDYIVSDHSKVEWVTYFDDALYSDLNDNMFSQSWNGYGVYQPDLDQ